MRVCSEYKGVYRLFSRMCHGVGFRVFIRMHKDHNRTYRAGGLGF